MRKEFRKYWAKRFELEEDKETDEWWRDRLSINGFNAAFKNIAVSSMNVRDESMSEIRFLDDGKRKLTSLVLYFPQAGATGDRVKDSCLLFYRGPCYSLKYR